jgi:hypothetical protein
MKQKYYPVNTILRECNCLFQIVSFDSEIEKYTLKCISGLPLNDPLYSKGDTWSLFHDDALMLLIEQGIIRIISRKFIMKPPKNRTQ